MHPSAREFCTQLFQTQLFQRFIEQASLYVHCLLLLLFHPRCVCDAHVMRVWLPGFASDGTLAPGGEQENFWLSARSMSVIWKSEPADEPAKVPPRQIQRAPSPFKSKEPTSLLSKRSMSQRRASLNTIDAFPMFDAQVYDELLAQSSADTSASNGERCSSDSDPRLSPSAGGKAENSRVRPASPTVSSSSFSRAGFNSTASKLVSAARERVEAETADPHRC